MDPNQPKTPQLERYRIDYWDEKRQFRESVYIEPFPFMKGDRYPAGLTEAIALQDETIKAAIDSGDAIVATMLLDPKFLDILKRYAAVVPIEGGKIGIDLKNLLDAGDYLQVAKLFISTGYASGNSSPNFNEFEPSAIAQLNRMDFQGKLVKFAVARAEAKQKEMEAKQKEMEAKEVVKVEEIPQTDTPPIAVASGTST